MDGTLSASKERIWRGYQDVVRRRNGRFAHDIASRVQLKDARAERKNDKVVSTTVVCEAVVKQDMLNGGGRVHGACLAYLVDLCTTFALQLHSIESGGNGDEGTTQTLNVVYHAPAPEDVILRIACTSLSVDDKTMSGKCEVWDADNKRLVASGMQLKSTTLPRAKL
ncbi:hypothetical protein AURDEDRAFT_183832 [Auricularia subglabra TFB-10046 SS5]|nr:hypothetical protein AURDEDRAFT_183832 [Auricularia subglabra TFB-10046 SS5]